MEAILSRFAFLVEGRLDGKGFYRHVEIAAFSLDEAQAIATRDIVAGGGEVVGFDEIDHRGPALTPAPGVVSATGLALFPLAES